ncbi:tetratricopeptide repeat protein [Candidatus Parcubacteria bacterium]|nr:tetratricopeptide repeat protein [Candidatus Parcubacteria bacterium]
MKFQLIGWSRILYLAGMVLALILVVPTAWFPFQLAKVAAFALLLLGSVILFVVGRGTRDLVRSHGFYAALLTAALPLSYGLSYLFTQDASVGFSGYGIEVDTIVFSVMAFLAFMLSFGLFQTQRTVRMLLSTLFVVLAAAVLFQTISVLIGLPIAAFADRSVNLIGKWNDLGLIAGLLAVLLLIRVELMQSSRVWQVGTVIGGILLVFLLGVVNFPLAWGMLLTFSIVLGLLKFVQARFSASDDHTEPRTWIRGAPWFSIGAAGITIIFLFFGPSVNTALTSMFPVSSLEVRPSYDSTLQVVNASRGGMPMRVLVGNGPSTFGEQWLVNKPTEVNQSAFWNLDFNVGFSTVVTALGTVGILGALAWLLPMLLVIAGIIRVMRSTILSREDKTLATALSLSSIFLFVSLLLYVPSPNLVLLAMVLSGAAFGFLWRQGQPASVEALSRMGSTVNLASMVVLLVLAFAVTSTVERRFLAQTYVGYGVSQLNGGGIDKALAAAKTANNIEKNFDAYRLELDAGSGKIQQIATNTSLPTGVAQQQFASTTADTISAAQAAISIHPQDYRPQLALANLYTYLASLQIQGAADIARTTYKEAQKNNPKNPQVPLFLSRLEFATGNNNLGQQYLSDSLTLKPNYTDAILFLVQLHIANNDLRNAVIAAQAAVQSAPGVGPLWFQLGLLYYSGADTKDAIPALEQALAIIPDYANAKYFLGLSYYAENKPADGIRMFEDLARTNPDNTEVKTILSNMKAGKKALDGITPPSPEPEKRDQAPVSE